jgi:hypothetical protein
MGKQSIEERFSDLVKLDRINSYVDVHEIIIKRWGEKGNVPVLVREMVSEKILPDCSDAKYHVSIRDTERLRAISILDRTPWAWTTVHVLGRIFRSSGAKLCEHHLRLPPDLCQA